MMQRLSLTPEIDFSRLAYGLWRILDDPNHSVVRLQEKIETCLGLGITTFDQADIYGGYKAEAALGETLRRAPALRDRMEIITKCGIVAPTGRYSHHKVKHYNTSKSHITSSVDSSLALMQIDHIDLLLIHRSDPFMNPDETGLALDGVIESGKVRAVGVSNFKPFEIDLLSSRMSHPLLTNQIEMSLTSNEAFTNGDLAYLNQHQMLPMAWSPLGGGSLFRETNQGLIDRLNELALLNETDIASVAVAWLLAHPANILPIFGTNAIARITSMAQAVEIEIDRETWFELYELAKGSEVP